MSVNAPAAGSMPLGPPQRMTGAEVRGGGADHSHHHALPHHGLAVQLVSKGWQGLGAKPLLLSSWSV